MINKFILNATSTFFKNICPHVKICMGIKLLINNQLTSLNVLVDFAGQNIFFSITCFLNMMN